MTAGRDKRIGDILVSRGLITAGDLDSALEIQRRTHQKLGEILMEQGLLHDDDLDASLNAQMMSLFSELSNVELTPEEQETEAYSLQSLLDEVSSNTEKHKITWEPRHR